MAQSKLEAIAIDRFSSYQKKLKASERIYQKRIRKRGQYSRQLEVAINLYNYMRSSGKSRAELAKQLGVSQAYICNLINGKLNPTIGTIEKYEHLLSIDLLPRIDCHLELPLSSSLPKVQVNNPKGYFNDSKGQSKKSPTYGYQLPFLAY